MTERLLLDTDVLIEYLRGREAAVDWLEARTEELLVSAVTVAELFSGVRDDREERALERFLGAFEVVPVDLSIARLGGLLRRDHSPGSGTGLADALIAASVLRREAILVTFNRRHYPMLEGVREPFER